MIPPSSPSNHPPGHNGNGNGNGSALPFQGAMTPAGLFFPDGMGQGLAPQTAGTAGSGLNLLALLKGLRRRWFLAFALGLFLGVAAAAGAWFFFPPSKYVARTRLEIDPNAFIFFPDAFRQRDFGTYQKHQMALVKSRLVLNSALDQEGVAKLPIVKQELEPIDWLEREVKVDFLQSPNIMQISMTGDEPDQLVTIVNGIRMAYLKEIIDKERTERLNHFNMLENLHKKYETAVADKRLLLKKLTEKGLSDPTSRALRQSMAEEQLARTRSKLMNLQDELKALRASLAAYQKKHANSEQKPAAVDLPEERIEEALEKHDVIRAAKADLDLREAAYAQAKTTAEEGSTVLKRPLERRDQAKSRLEELKKQFRPIVTRELLANAGRPLPMHVPSAEIQMQITISENLNEILSADLERHEKEAEKLKRQAVDSLDLEFLKGEIAQSEGLMNKIGSQLQAMRIELPAPERVRTLEEGLASRNQDDKKRLMATAVAGLAVLGLTLFGVSWLESRLRRIDTVDEVVSGLGMRIVGAIPGMPTRNWRNWVTSAETRNHYWRRLLTESVDAARTMLLHAAKAEGIKTVMISSAVGGEGKTSLASHLSASLARAGRKTLLIDGDIRKPSLHKLFETAAAPGLSEYLRGEADQAALLQPTSVNGLFLISAGHGDALAIQGLARDPLRNLLKTVREEFDFILVDTSPVLPVADSLLIAQHVDGVLFSILRDVSRFPKVYAAYQRLASLGARILGAVVNGTRSESYGSDYYYYYAGRIGATDSASE